MFRDVESLLRPKVIAIVGASEFQPRRLGAGNLRQPRPLRLSGQALPRQSEAQGTVGPPGLSGFRLDPGARRPCAHHRALAVDSRHAHRSRQQRTEMRADLRRAIRRRRRPAGLGARAGAEESSATAGFASPARTAWARWRCARSSCSIQRSACARCGRARSAWCSSPAARSSSGCSRPRCAASIFPTRCRAATNSTSISPTTSASWSTTSIPRSSPAWSKASGGRRRSWPRRRRRSRRASPSLLVKLGRSERGKAAAVSHTGAIAGDDAVFDAVCRKYGVVRVPSLDDLIETSLAFTQSRLPKGPRIAMACYSGGAKGLILDYAGDHGAEMAPLTAETKSKLLGMIDPGLAAENPLDVGPTVGVQAAKFAEICKVVCADPTVDLVTVQGLVPVNPDDPVQPRPTQERRGFDRQAGAGVRPHRAERIRDEPQVPERDGRAVHPGTAGDGARAASAGALRRGA